MLRTAVFFSLTAMLVLSGCSSTVRTYTDTLKLAFTQGEDAFLTKAELAERKADALYAKVGNKPTAVLGLAFLEHNQQKWISADEAMLVIEKGRVVKTTGFSNNLMFQSNRVQDPLKQAMVKINQGQQWTSHSDWSENNEAGYHSSYEIIQVEVTSLALLEHSFQTKLVAEQVTFADGTTAINLFWYDLSSGYLLKTKQTIAPFWPELELTFISSAGRLLGIRNAGNRK